MSAGFKAPCLQAHVAKGDNKYGRLTYGLNELGELPLGYTPIVLIYG